MRSKSLYHSFSIYFRNKGETGAGGLSAQHALCVKAPIKCLKIKNKSALDLMAAKQSVTDLNNLWP